MTDLDLTEVGRRVALLRIVEELTQEALAEAAGMSRPSIANIERGRQDLPLTRAVALAGALGCVVSVLTGEVEDPRLVAAADAEAKLAGIDADLERLTRERAELMKTARAMAGGMRRA